MSDVVHRLLIITDRIESVAVLLGCLRDQPFDVLVAVGVDDGMRKALSARPDVILLGHGRPAMDGIAACRRVMADPRISLIPVIFLSCDAGLPGKLEAFDAGAVDYIVEPYSVAEVLARVRVQLRLHQALRPAANPDAETPMSRADAATFEAAVNELRLEHVEWQGLDPLAKRLGTSAKKLTRLFRCQLGVTVFEHLTQIRLERSCRFLADTGVQVQQIADRCGFRNPSDFSRAFKRRYGISPRSYRQAQQAPGATGIH